MLYRILMFVRILVWGIHYYYYTIYTLLYSTYYISCIVPYRILMFVRILVWGMYNTTILILI